MAAEDRINPFRAKCFSLSQSTVKQYESTRDCQQRTSMRTRIYMYSYRVYSNEYRYSYGGVHRTSLYFIDHIRCQSESLSSMFIIVQIGVRIEAS